MVESIYFLKPAWCGAHRAGLWPEQDFQSVTVATAFRRWFSLAFFVSILTGAIFGLVPALQTVRPNQAGNLREGSRGSGSSKHQIRILRILVSSEIALSLVLLIGAGLLLRSFRHLLEVRPGFEPHRLMTARITLPLSYAKALDAYSCMEERV